jgi:hypothetical protein
MSLAPDELVADRYPCAGDSGQRFQVTGAGEIKAASSGGCVEVTGDDVNNGNQLQVRPCNGAANQRWRFGG